RRHTRFSRDWSSDVCSSDLILQPHRLPGPAGTAGAVPSATVTTVVEPLPIVEIASLDHVDAQLAVPVRGCAGWRGVAWMAALDQIGKRRVGKEWGGRRAAES